MRPQQIIPDLHVQQPQSEMEELMMLFGNAPWSDRAEIAEIVMDTIDMLPDRSATIINALFYEQCSYVELGEKLGCSGPHAWRLSRVAFEELRQALLQNPIIKEKYT